jgi:hypothetical protein
VNGSSPQVSPTQVSALDSSAQSTGGSRDVGQSVLPCQAWTLDVKVESTVPFHPEKPVSVSFKATAGASDYQSKSTQMDGPTSPPVELKGGGAITYSVSASNATWESAGGASVDVSPNPTPFTATVKIQPKQPWVIIKVMNDATSALIPKFDVGLKLGDGARKMTTADKQTLFEALRTETSDGMVTTSGDATKFGLSSLGHPDEIWEFVTIATT